MFANKVWLVRPRGDCAKRATLAKLKSSEMTARQPSVPDLIGATGRDWRRNFPVQARWISKITGAERLRIGRSWLAQAEKPAGVGWTQRNDVRAG
jgi:hypothetical protein